MREEDLQRGQLVTIARNATAFTIVCAACAEGDGTEGATFAGRLDLDLERGLFLCRRGHTVTVQREPAAHRLVGAEEAA